MSSKYRCRGGAESRLCRGYQNPQTYFGIESGVNDRNSHNLETGGRTGHETQFSAVMERLTDVLTDQRNRLPEVVVAKFSGDPLEYNSFVRSFDSRIASRTSDESERLYYLEQYTSGTPREMVRSCMHMTSGMGYIEARKRLDRRFGDKFLLAQAYLKRLEFWPVIRSDDVERLDEFITFLVGCCNAMTCSNSIKELDYPTSLRLIVSKLPGYLQDRWVRTADSIFHSDGDILLSHWVSWCPF